MDTTRLPTLAAILVMGAVLSACDRKPTNPPPTSSPPASQTPTSPGTSTPPATAPESTSPMSPPATSPGTSSTPTPMPETTAPRRSPPPGSSLEGKRIVAAGERDVDQPFVVATADPYPVPQRPLDAARALGQMLASGS